MSAVRHRFIVLTYLFALLSLPYAFASTEQDIIGFWDIFDKSGTLDTTIEIYETSQSGVLEGRAVKLHRPQDQGATCTACSGEKLNKPILGLEVLSNLQWNPKKNGWFGEALDPERGWEPRIRLRLEGNELKACAHYKTDWICIDTDSWSKRVPDEEFLNSLQNIQ